MRKGYIFIISGIGLVAIGTIAICHYRKGRVKKSFAVTGENISSNKQQGGNIKTNLTEEQICYDNCVASGWSKQECAEDCYGDISIK
jgi:hypothetical protein